MKKSILILDTIELENSEWKNILSFCTLYEAWTIYSELLKEPGIKNLSEPKIICSNFPSNKKKYKKEFEIIHLEEPYYYSIKYPREVSCNIRCFIYFKTDKEFWISKFIKSHNIDFGIIKLMEFQEAKIFNDPVNVYIW